MYRREPAHLEEWATLLGEDVSEELLADESHTWADPGPKRDTDDASPFGDDAT